MFDLSVLQQFVRTPTRFTFSHADKSIPPLSPSAPSALHFVPDELLEEILSFCPSSTLCQLSLTDWRLNRIANSFLYKDAKPSSADKMLVFFITVCMQPYLARHVRTLDIEHSLSKVMLDTPFNESIFARRLRKLGNRRTNSHKPILRNALTLVNAALKSMTSLTNLTLIMPDGDAHVEYTSLLSGVEFQLLHFHTSIRINDEVIAFLAKQSLLEDLKIYSTAPNESHYLQSLPTTALPSLTALSWSSKTSMEAVRALLSNRPVTKATIHLHPGTAFSNVLSVGPQASKQITTINLAFRDRSRPSATQLRTLATAFPHIESLSLSFAALSKGTVQQITDAIESFFRIKELCLFEHSPRDELEREDLMALTDVWFTLSKPLKSITFNLCEPSTVTKRVTRRRSET
ncbi:hypothetical protein CPB83DRAFT_860737 [Crepidotus variabilis]|uniref:F-box domain-containing protein n=1 Tax=Crepidotus variabilis TaxID=179855 RepID=A0A9P6E8S4_9AGAR|nr:hypothetical protein CPB83DRAFT_860737 [Crepidotus variabilis]